MIVNILIGTWFAFVVASAFAHQWFKRNVQKSYGASINEAFKNVTESLARIEKVQGDQQQMARLKEPKEATRVYAVLIQRNFETRLIVQPANTFEEMSIIVTRELGTGWMTLISAFADVTGWKKDEQPSSQSTESTTALVEKPIAHFIHDLEYSRDTLAESPAQKEAVDEIIRKLKSQHYGHSRSGSAA